MSNTRKHNDSKPMPDPPVESTPDTQAMNLFDSLPFYAMVIDEDHRILYVNSAVSKAVGRAAKELIGEHCPQIIHGTKRPFPGCPLEKAVKSGRAEETEFLDEESGRWLRSAVYPIGDITPAGKRFYVHVTMDITERKAAEDKLARSEHFLQNVFSSINEGLSILDTDMVITKVNPMMEKWYAHAMPLVGKVCWEAYHDRTEPCEVCPGRTALDSKHAASEVIPRIGDDGSVTGWLDVHCSPLFDVDTGEVTGVIEYVRDISARRAVEESLHHLAEDLMLINTINKETNSGRPIDEIIEIVCEETKRTFSSNGANVYTLDHDRRCLLLQTRLRVGEKTRKRIEQLIGTEIPAARVSLDGDGVHAQVMENRKPVIIEDEDTIRRLIEEHAPTAILKKLAGKILKILNISSVVLIPLIVDDSCIGLMSISRKEPFTTYDMERLIGIANELSAAIGRVRAVMTLADREEEYRTLVENLPGIIYRASFPDGGVVYMNDLLETFTGYRPEELCSGLFYH